MGYAKHVGRVGALAVALGIGAAVATTPGVAWADGETETNVEAPSNPEPPAGADTTGTTTPSTEHRTPARSSGATSSVQPMTFVTASVRRSPAWFEARVARSLPRIGTVPTPNNGNVPPVIVEGEDEPVEQPETPKDERKSTTFVANNNPANVPQASHAALARSAGADHGETAPKPLAKAVDDVKA